jgi:hypothetical protein
MKFAMLCESRVQKRLVIRQSPRSLGAEQVSGDLADSYMKIIYGSKGFYAAG